MTYDYKAALEEFNRSDWNKLIYIEDIRSALTEAQKRREHAFYIGQRVTKIKGSKWTGRVCGVYATDLTPEGYAVESETETGSVQIYPAAALTAASTQGD